MSFFIKKKPNLHGKSKGVKKSSKRKHLNQDDELTSSSEAESAQSDDQDESDPDETAQAKKMRLAKAYLKEIEREVEEREEDEEQHDDLTSNEINKRLRTDYLKQSGKLRTTIADKYQGFNSENIKILRCKDHKNCITSTFITAGNEFIFSGSKDGSIVKWSIKDLKKVGSIPFVKKSSSETFKGHSKAILSIAISMDNKFMAIGDETKDIQIWNPQTLEHINTLKGHRLSVTGVVFCKETHTLYSSSKDRSVKVWSLDEMAYVETLYGHHDAITSIDALSRQRAVTTGGRDATVRLWKIMEESQLIYNGPDGCLDVVKLVNEDIFVTGGDDGQLSVWSANRKKPLCAVKEAHGLDSTNLQPYWISSLCSLVNTDVIASGSQDGAIRIWKLSDRFRNIQLLFKIPLNGFVNSLNFTSDGKFLIAGVGPEHKLGRWNVLKSIKTAIVVIPLIKDS
ncbi:U3 small nucleolar RNA-interacting protein 2 [Onthophagus taurus]|uniref:U3 small nucleolar RNA-interacting protein 2 n=1 Tax=Onthophagus taurus TaxID=166361 RepID=UPI0039BE8AD9